MVDDEIRDAQFIIELGVVVELFRSYGRFNNAVNSESCGEKSLNTGGERSVKVGEVDIHHSPVTFGFLEIAVNDHVELCAVFCSVPMAFCRPHGVQVGDDKSAAGFEDAIRLRACLP